MGKEEGKETYMKGRGRRRDDEGRSGTGKREEGRGAKKKE